MRRPVSVSPSQARAIPSSADDGCRDAFVRRHIGPDEAEIQAMLETVGQPSLDALIDNAVPDDIRMDGPLDLPPARTEAEALSDLRRIAARNTIHRAYIGMGYHGCIVPAVIQRNVLENPGWYTQYTPYQAEISQGRLEALLNFQTMVADLTGLPLAGASLLDEATAAAEAMAMCYAISRQKKNRFLVTPDCHPQTIAVVQTRARSMGLEVDVVQPDEADFASGDVCGVLVQYPATDGRIECHEAFAARAKEAGAMVVAATDLLALTLIRPPGEWGADIAVGSAQRFGVPMGFGGPHAAFLATRDEHARRMPGRIIGVSRDAEGNPAFRMAIQTREQHIKRDRATSNICTAQALLAIMSAMYAVYHGPDGLRGIATHVHTATEALRAGLRKLGHDTGNHPVFDTLRVTPTNANAEKIYQDALERGINLRRYDDGALGIALDETVTEADLTDLLELFGGKADQLASLYENADTAYPEPFVRTSDYLTHPVFNTHHSETELLRYLHRLQARDLSLTHSMIPLGSCTMKLNATSEMLPVTWPEFAHLHPFAPEDQTRGYAELFQQLEDWLAEITGFDTVSLQPNAGSQGEYSGLLVIRAYHEARGDTQRDICLIPESAHGTNPASAVIAGFRVVPIKCDDRGNIDIDDLNAKAGEHRDRLGAIMITYPSTHGVFEPTIRQICNVVHEHGGQVYLDGANLNAQVGLCRPGDYGADVCHLNLHKTFCIPHGGGGPGMGPIGVAPHLSPFLPGHPVREPASRGEQAIGPIAAAPYGSPSILTISWMYIAMMGPDGLTRASQVAILNANYMAARLAEHYRVLYTGTSGLVAHEFILDCRDFEKSAGIRIEDIAKRLMDYSFHAPTMAWPVPGTLMVEPTESESKAELDRFCEAMIHIRQEIDQIESGKADKDDNPLRNAPHTVGMVTADEWSHAYPRSAAAYPADWLRDNKFWPPVARVDNPYGDRNLVCTCPPVSEMASMVGD